jgi:hypothetical protein
VSEATALVQQAVILGWPTVVMARTRLVSLYRPAGGAAAMAPNMLRHAQRLATHRNRNVVMPNSDTLYSSAWLDLGSGAQWLTLPAQEQRYQSWQLMDAATETLGVLHPPRAGTDLRVLLAGPGWEGASPEGATVLRSATAMNWLLGRTEVRGLRDLAEAAAVQQAATLAPAVPMRPAKPEMPLEFLPPQDAASAGLGMLDEIAALWQDNPPPATQWPLLRRLAAIGMVPGGRPATWLRQRGWETEATFAVQAADAQVLARARQSMAMDSGVPRWVWGATGTYGDDALLRAATAQRGLGALPPSEALYFSLGRQATGEPLRGAVPQTLQLNLRALPANGAFWSLSLYDAESLFFVANPLERFAIGSHTPGFEPDGNGHVSIDIAASQPARGAQHWLPAPQGAYVLVFRVYRPSAAAADYLAALPLTVSS